MSFFKLLNELFCARMKVMVVELDCSLGLKFAHATWDPCLVDEFDGCFGEEVVMKMD